MFNSSEASVTHLTRLLSSLKRFVSCSNSSQICKVPKYVDFFPPAADCCFSSCTLSSICSITTHIRELLVWPGKNSLGDGRQKINFGLPYTSKVLFSSYVLGTLTCLKLAGNERFRKSKISAFQNTKKL